MFLLDFKDLFLYKLNINDSFWYDKKFRIKLKYIII